MTMTFDRKAGKLTIAKTLDRGENRVELELI